MQDLRKSVEIRVEKSEEKFRQEILGRSHGIGKVINGQYLHTGRTEGVL